MEVPRTEVVVIAALCVWRITHLVTAEDGPWRMIATLRRLASRVLPAGLLDCFYCTSLWVAVPFAIACATGWRGQLVLALAGSAGAILLERLSTRTPAEVAVPYFEREVEDVGMLREKIRSDDEAEGRPSGAIDGSERTCERVRDGERTGTEATGRGVACGESTVSLHRTERAAGDRSA